MMKRSTPLLCALVGLAVWLGGCKVTDEGTPYANQPPTTMLTVAPLEGDTVNHYITLRWSATDPDGEVVAFKLMVDGQLVSVTAARDTTIGFPAPLDSEIVQHTFSVSAIDNEGLEGLAASRMFYTINFTPSAAFDPDGSVPNNATVSPGFRMTVAGNDPNPSTMRFAISIDDTLSWIWSSDSVFLFADRTLHRFANNQTVVGVDDDGDGRIDEELENRDANGNPIDDDHDGRIDEDTRGLYPEHVTVVANDLLMTPGQHVLYARVMDAGGALSTIVERHVTVLADRVPTLDTVVTGTYGGNDIFPDGSVYYAQNQETKIVFHATAVQYRGEINAYRNFFAQADSVFSDWGDWSASPELVFQNLPLGDYTIRMVARDLSGTPSDTVTFTLRIVEQHLTTNIVIVDETRDGPGGPGAPNDVTVDDFYAALFEGYNFTQVDYTAQQYVSPYDLKDAGLVMWHGDDKAELKLGDNTRVLREFLDKGGRLILSGWDVMGPLTAQADYDSFSTGSFAYTKLRAVSATRNLERTATGFAGVNGYPSCEVDPAKLPSSFAGAMDKLWTFHYRPESVRIGNLTVNNPDTNPLSGRPATYVYDLSFRVAVFGVPLFFCRIEQATALMDILIPQMLAGLGPS